MSGDLRVVGGDAAERPLLSELYGHAGADHAPGSAATDGSAALVRPAARSAAVRPHSTCLPLAQARFAPRPGSAASSCFASLFFAPSPRPIGRQSCWLAVACSHCGWEHGLGWERVGEQESRAFSDAYATVPTVPTAAPARVMRSRARAPIHPSSCLGTWEQCLVLVSYQRLALFPRLFPAARRPGTWEQAKRRRSSTDRLRGRSNKVRAGYGAQQPEAVGARRNFGRSSAPIGRDLVELGQLAAAGGARIRQLRTRRGRNGGNRPFPSAPIGHVGRAMLEGRGQAPAIARLSSPTLKLRRLRDVDLGELAGELLELGRRAAGADRARPPGTPPNAARLGSSPSPLQAGGIWIELRSGAAQAAVPAGQFPDRSSAIGRERPQNSGRRRGPGGARGSIEPKNGRNPRNSVEGRRAGVVSRLQVRGSTVPAERSRLRRETGTVKAGIAA